MKCQRRFHKNGGSFESVVRQGTPHQSVCSYETCQEQVVGLTEALGVSNVSVFFPRMHSCSIVRALRTRELEAGTVVCR